MMTLREVHLPSGAMLKVQPAKFTDARALLAAVTAEFRSFAIASETQIAAVWKELACIGFSSASVEKALWSCMQGCLYLPAGSEVPLKLAADIFEAVERRDDYISVCMEVAKENIGPFMKSLFALFSRAQEAASGSAPGSASPTTSSSSTSGSAATATPGA